MISIINSFGQIWTSYFGPILVQNTLFLGFVFLLLYIFKEASAQTKYNIGLIGIIKLLIPPFIPLVLPVSGSVRSQIFPVNLFIANTGPLAQKDVAAVASKDVAFDIYGLLLLIWLAVIFIYLLYSLISSCRLAMILNKSMRIPENELNFLTNSNKLQIFKSRRISIPVTCAILPGKIFVPHTWDLWTEECKRMVIQHEQAHVKRYDNFMQVLQIFTQAIYFFHPLVLLLNRQLREFREMACDDMSVELNHQSRVNFSKYLVEIAETAVKNPLACKSVSALIKHKNGLLKRVQYQLKEAGMYKLSKTSRWGSIITVLLFIPPFSFYLAANEPVFSSQHDSRQIVEVSLTANNEIKINGTLTALEKFKNTIQDKMKDQKDRIIIAIRGEQDITMSQLYILQKKLREMGMFRVAYVESSGENIRLMLPPPGNEKKLQQISEEKLLRLLVTADSKVLVNDITFNLSDIKVIVQKHLAENEHKIVIIRGEPEAKYEDFLAVLQQTQQAGAKRIVVNK